MSRGSSWQRRRKGEDARRPEGSLGGYSDSSAPFRSHQAYNPGSATFSTARGCWWTALSSASRVAIQFAKAAYKPGNGAQTTMDSNDAGNKQRACSQRRVRERLRAVHEAEDRSHRIYRYFSVLQLDARATLMDGCVAFVEENRTSFGDQFGRIG